jgi:tetratricopeptide (TPR) repeat protein
MTKLTLQQAFELAVRHHQAGQLSLAETLYRQILAQNPGHFGAMQYLGLVAHQAGQSGAAVDLIRRAIALQPNNAEAYLNLGAVLRGKGDLDESIAVYRQALALNPRLALAYNNLGNALKDKGKLDEAVDSYRQCLVLMPDHPEAHNNLANILKGKGQLDEAIAGYRQALALRPNSPETHVNLGSALCEKGQLDEAITSYREALTLKPDLTEALINLGSALSDKGQLNEAIASYRQALALKPDSSVALNNLGNGLREKGELEEAIACYKEALALEPDYAEAYDNLSTSLSDKGQYDEAIASARKAIALKPGYSQAHCNLAFLLLRQGDWSIGWKEYEWRRKVKNFPSPRRNFPQPQWDGSDLKDRNLFIHCEQGFGDALQFVRYIPMIGQSGARVVVECLPELERLLRGNSGGWQVVALGQTLPDFDVYCPMLSLPLALAATQETIPAAIPYLHADATIRSKWQDRLERESHGFKVGIAWAGSKTHKNDRNRSIALSTMAPLGRVNGIRFFSLQKSQDTRRGDVAPTGFEPIDWTDELTDFADTAAMIANLDLVISVDTSVAHLAGAMGKPVWVMLPFASDWRWFIDREDSPWYPTMRLFRQTVWGSWEEVVSKIGDALAAWVGSRRP